MKDWFVPIVVAVVVCAALLYGFAVSLQPSPPSPVTLPTPPVATDPWSPGNDPPTSSPRPPSATALEAPPDVATLRARCVEESRSGKGLTQALSSACQEYAQASRSTLPSPQLAPTSPRFESPAAAVRPRPAEGREGGLSYIYVVINECAAYGQGSIDYRRCRAREGERLRRECQHYTQKAEMANGKQRQTLRTYARSYCRESNRYHVID